MSAVNNSINNHAYSFGTTAGITAGNNLTVTTGGLTVTAGSTTLTPLAGTNGGVVVSSTTGVITHIENSTTNGQVLISKSDGTNPVWASITAGSNITITPGANSITIASSGGSGMAITEVTADVSPMVIDNGYITNKAGSACSLALPTTAAVGSILEVIGKGATGWVITQGSGQAVILGNTATTTGATGTLASSDTGDCVRLVCITADTIFRVVTSVGNLTLA